MDTETKVCTTPAYHDTHAYCPSCDWRDETMRGRKNNESDRLRDALGDVLFMVEDANGNLTDENLSDIRDCVMSALDLK